MTSVLITGPSRNLGRSTALALADRGTDLLLVGRNLSGVAAEARDRGARVHEITADLARLADVRAAAATAKNLIDTGTVRPLRALIGNAGMMSGDTRRASADGYELTFAVNHLAHAQLIADLHGTLTAPARIVLLGSNTYHQNIWRRLLGVPEARIGVAVFEPGWMPGTALGRDAPPAAQAAGRALAGRRETARPTASICSSAVRPRALEPGEAGQAAPACGEWLPVGERAKTVEPASADTGLNGGRECPPAGLRSRLSPAGEVPPL